MTTTNTVVAKRRHGRTAWCEVSVDKSQDGTQSLGSYGGEVWPEAWPALFCRINRGTHGGWFELTDEGRALFAAAEVSR